jgi:23S rRNA (adenine2503-C2)-methyltransferase
MESIYGQTLAQLETTLTTWGQKAYYAQVIYDWVYEKKIRNFSDMTNLSLALRTLLQQHFHFDLPSIHVRRDSLDRTVKLLLKLADGFLIEAVLMRYNYGNVICVTTQVGCNVGCSFCASGLLKRQRNLTAGEMIAQIVVMNDLLDQEGKKERVSHIVCMGTGEPFDNYDHVMNFIRIANHQKALAIGARHITVSTSGFPEKIIQYGREPLQINLAVSLHAPTNEIRTKLMRINQAFPLEKLMLAIKDYQQHAGRRITFEYILIEGINDQLEHADLLADLIQDVFCYVNLIPYNAVMENEYRRPHPQAVNAFMSRLIQKGINATVRKEFGHDIEAACGQLRAKHKHEEAR